MFEVQVCVSHTTPPEPDPDDAYITCSNCDSEVPVGAPSAGVRRSAKVLYVATYVQSKEEFPIYRFRGSILKAR